jgi:hypothetical protein
LEQALYARQPEREDVLIHHSDSKNALASFPGWSDSHSDRPVGYWRCDVFQVA